MFAYVRACVSIALHTHSLWTLLICSAKQQGGDASAFQRDEVWTLRKHFSARVRGKLWSPEHSPVTTRECLQRKPEVTAQAKAVRTCPQTNVGCEERETFKCLSCSLGVREFPLIQKDQSNGKGVGPEMNVDSVSGTSHGGCKGPRMEPPLGKLREYPSSIYQALDWKGDGKAHLFVIVSDPSSGGTFPIRLLPVPLNGARTSWPFMTGGMLTWVQEIRRLISRQAALNLPGNYITHYWPQPGHPHPHPHSWTHHLIRTIVSFGGTGQTSCWSQLYELMWIKHCPSPCDNDKLSNQECWSWEESF